MSSALLQVISADAEPLTEEAALAEAQTLQPIQLNATVLAAHWGWHRSRVQRRLRRWSKEGLIEPPAKAKPGAKKKSARAAGQAFSGATADNVDRHMAEREMQTGGLLAGDAASQPAEKVEEIAGQANDNSQPPIEDRPHVPFRRMVLAIILVITAVTLGVVGLLLNMGFAYSFGRTSQAGQLLAAVGVVLDVLTLILPTVAALLWETRQRMAAAGTWTIFGLALTMSLIAACGFAATNIGDTIENRTDVTGQRAALSAKLERLRRERSGISETRSITAIDAALQATQPAAEAVWKQTRQCQDVTLRDSGKACATVLALRQARGEAVRRDGLDVDIRQAEAEFTSLPAYASADPGAEMAAKLIRRVSGGYAPVTAESVEQVRIGGLTVTPAAGGLLLSFATLLWRPVRRRKMNLGPCGGGAHAGGSATHAAMR
jgi:hypothetical protein